MGPTVGTFATCLASPVTATETPLGVGGKGRSPRRTTKGATTGPIASAAEVEARRIGQATAGEVGIAASV